MPSFICNGAGGKWWWKVGWSGRKRGGVRVRTLVFPRGPRAYFSTPLHWRLRSGAPEARTYFFSGEPLSSEWLKVLVILSPCTENMKKKCLSKMNKNKNDFNIYFQLNFIYVCFKLKFYIWELLLIWIMFLYLLLYLI